MEICKCRVTKITKEALPIGIGRSQREELSSLELSIAIGSSGREELRELCVVLRGLCDQPLMKLPGYVFYTVTSTLQK